MQHGQSGTDKSGPLTYTQSYVFNKADILGKGATATVFLGRHREQGYVVAIKEFDRRQIRQILTAKEREIEILGNIKHTNIMTLLACEPESVSNQEVMVMEYCQGGSVQTLLEKPQNMFGFVDREFLQFIKDICCGLKHLRSMNIIHRDIKPGNIMKKINDDGSSMYVLTDFGAARELPEDETFMSIYGTEEYIHPDMYQRAVLGQAGHDRFDSSVDLWSLGVSLYHCACGRLPFRAYKGRQDPQTMYQITSGLKSGVISGVQKHLNGPIEWSTTLPETCHLSSSLCKLIEPILAGIFEPDQRRLITYDSVFKKIEDIVSMATIKVFVVQTATQVPLYTPKHEQYVHLQETIAKRTDIPANRQVLFVSNNLLSSIIDRNQHIQEYPKTLLKSQLFLFDKHDADSIRFKHSAYPEFPALVFGTSLASDANIAKRCTGIAYFIETKVKETLNNQSLIRQGLSHLWHHVMDELRLTEIRVPILEQLLNQSSARLQSLKLSQTTLKATLSPFIALDSSDCRHESSSDWLLLNGISLDDIVKKLGMRVQEIKVYLSVLIEKMKEQDLVYGVSFRGCEDEDRCLSKFQQLTQNINSVYTTFLKHKKCNDLHQHEIFIHTVESRKLEELCVKIASLYQSHCLQSLFTMHKAAVDYSSKLLKHLTRYDKVEANVKCVIDYQRKVNEKLDKEDERIRNSTQMLGETTSEIESSHIQGVQLSKSINSVLTRAESNQSAAGTKEQRELIRRILTESIRNNKRRAASTLVSQVENKRSRKDDMGSPVREAEVARGDIESAVLPGTSAESKECYKDQVKIPHL